VVSEVLRTAAVHVQLHPKANVAARIVIEVADAKSRDAILASVKNAAKS
jgi:hypothetical protein